MGSSKLSKIFDFDSTIQASTVYQAHARNLIKRAVREGPVRLVLGKSADRELPQQSTIFKVPLASAIDGQLFFSRHRAISAGCSDSAKEQRIVKILLDGFTSYHKDIFDQLKKDCARSLACDDFMRDSWRKFIISDVITMMQGIFGFWHKTEKQYFFRWPPNEDKTQALQRIFQVHPSMIIDTEGFRISDDLARCMRLLGGDDNVYRFYREKGDSEI